MKFILNYNVGYVKEFILNDNGDGYKVFKVNWIICSHLNADLSMCFKRKCMSANRDIKVRKKCITGHECRYVLIAS